MVLIAVDKHRRKILGYLCKNNETVAYCCSECDVEFASSSNLEKHMVKHEEPRINEDEPIINDESIDELADAAIPQNSQEEVVENITDTVDTEDNDAEDDLTTHNEDEPPAEVDLFVKFQITDCCVQLTRLEDSDWFNEQTNKNDVQTDENTEMETDTNVTLNTDTSFDTNPVPVDSIADVNHEDLAPLKKRRGRKPKWMTQNSIDQQISPDLPPIDNPFFATNPAEIAQQQVTEKKSEQKQIIQDATVPEEIFANESEQNEENPTDASKKETAPEEIVSKESPTQKKQRLSWRKSSEKKENNDRPAKSVRKRPPPEVCCLCGKQFKSSMVLQIHMKTHSNSSKKPVFPCNICGKQVSNLKMHLRQHKAEKPIYTEAKKSMKEGNKSEAKKPIDSVTPSDTKVEEASSSTDAVFTKVSDVKEPDNGVTSNENVAETLDTNYGYVANGEQPFALSSSSYENTSTSIAQNQPSNYGSININECPIVFDEVMNSAPTNEDQPSQSTQPAMDSIPLTVAYVVQSMDSPANLIFQPSVIQPNLMQPHYIQQNIMHHIVVQPNVPSFVQQNLVQQNLVQQNMVQQNMVQQNMVQQNMIQQHLIQQNVTPQAVLPQELMPQPIITPTAILPSAAPPQEVMPQTPITQVPTPQVVAPQNGNASHLAIQESEEMVDLPKKRKIKSKHTEGELYGCLEKLCKRTFPTEEKQHKHVGKHNLKIICKYCDKEIAKSYKVFHMKRYHSDMKAIRNGDAVSEENTPSEDVSEDISEDVSEDVTEEVSQDEFDANTISKLIGIPLTDNSEEQI